MICRPAGNGWRCQPRRSSQQSNDRLDARVAEGEESAGRRQQCRLTTRNTYPTSRGRPLPTRPWLFGGHPKIPVALGRSYGPVGQNTLHLRTGIVRLDSHTRQYLSYLGRGFTRVEIRLNS
jgi:hypothetical protein